MKTWSVVAVVAGLIMLASWEGMAIAQEASSPPNMVLEETEYRFGEVMEGTTVEHAFRVLNKGAQPLEILNVKPG
jgi:hypothetical protein